MVWGFGCRAHRRVPVERSQGPPDAVGLSENLTSALNPKPGLSADRAEAVCKKSGCIAVQLRDGRRPTSADGLWG